MVSSKWICKINYFVDRSKERLVARGFYQKEGINSEETLDPGSKVHGNCFHDEVGYTPNGCKDKASLMV